MSRRSTVAALSVLLLVAGLFIGWMARTPRPLLETDPAPAPPFSAHVSAPSADSIVRPTAPVPPSRLPDLSAAPPGTTATFAMPTVQASGQGQTSVAAGWALIQRRDYQGAIQAFRKSTAVSPEDPRLFLGLALSHYRLAQYESVLVNVKRALALDPALEQAHTLFGDLVFMQDDLDGAVHHYESALTLNPNDLSIQDGLYRVRRAQQLEAGFARIVTPHFVVKCEEAQRASLSGLADRLETLARRIDQQLQSQPDATIIVILYSDHRFQEVTDSPSWAGGLFDGKIHLAAQRVLHASADADAALAHEYTHALVHRLAGGQAPTWLDEGLALYFEGRTPSWSETLLDREADLMPLHALHGSFLSLPPRDATMAYAVSLSATRVLVHRFGWSRVRRLLESLSKTEDFSVVFETVLKEPYHTFEASWVAARNHRSL